MDSREPPDSDSDESVAPNRQVAAAFRRLFDLHFEELHRFAYRYVRSNETAKDLVQEAFLRLWRQRAQVDVGGPTARSYLCTVVRYQALDRLRHRRVEERWRNDNADPLMAADPDEEFTANEIATAIQRAVEALPERQRQVLQIRWQQQASYDEIAETLGISPRRSPSTSEGPSSACAPSSPKFDNCCVATHQKSAAAAWKRLRWGLTPGLGVRDRDYSTSLAAARFIYSTVLTRMVRAQGLRPSFLVLGGTWNHPSACGLNQSKTSSQCHIQ
jgi:RNA polymerase sigma-70 factor (ECF subfamily)